MKKKENMITIKRKYTNKELFYHIEEILKEKGLLPEILEYSLAENYHLKEFADYEWDIMGDLDFGCEGIYLSVYAEGCVTEQGKDEKVHLGTFKTLEAGRPALYIMAKLQADFMWETREFVNNHLADFTWYGYDVDFYKDEQKMFGMSCKNYDSKQRVLRLHLDRYDYAIVRDNITRKEVTVFSEQKSKKEE